MALTPGTRLGPYEVAAQIGVGGMGEVYRATDTNLKRAVAIKVLPASVAADAEHLARFQREAEVLAALNHPNIAAIYGLERSGATTALVMELVEGPTLADRLARGAIPLDEALPIAKQIAEALEAAHEQGIIHRDLKPANIKVRSDGTVKVLDFGLAKAMEPAAGSSPSMSMSPTLSIHATQAGIILGTAAYMAPEQARGKSVDKRADLWAFGCVLFEMLTARRAFAGDDITDTIVAVVTKEPDWTALPQNAVTIQPLIAQCLKKDAKRRLQAIGDARVQVEDLISGESAPVVQQSTPVVQRAALRSRSSAPAALAMLVGGAGTAALVTWMLMRSAPPEAPKTSRFTIVPPAAMPLAIRGADHDLAVSPDGRNLVYRAGPSGAVGAPLMVRALDQLEARPLPGITNARGPFFSPDGKWIGFFDEAELKKVALSGGPALALCRFAGLPRGGTWADDGTIVFATNAAAGLQRVPSGGGETTALTKPDAATQQSNHLFPSALPGGRGVLFTIAVGSGAESTQIAVLDAKTGRAKVLIRGGSDAAYSGTGHLVYAASGTLRAVRFNLDTLEVLGDAFPVAESVVTSAVSTADYAISRAGTLVYVPAGAGSFEARVLSWVDRQGREESLGVPPRAYNMARLSPDGTQIALEIRDQENDVWRWDIAHKTLTRLTFDRGFDTYPVWSRDGRRVFFSSSRNGAANIYAQSADNTGAVERLTTSPNSQSPTDVTPDGTQVIGHEVSPETATDVMLYSLNSPAAAGQPLVRTPFTEANAALSRDGRYVAYQSSETGRFEVYVRPFPKTDAGKWQVSANGGTRPVWSNGELHYLDTANSMMAVPVQTGGGTFAYGNAVKLFDNVLAAGILRSFDVTPDGRRFLTVKNSVFAVAPGSFPIVVVLNWQAEQDPRK